MFSKNLSTPILQLCSSRDLSYEKAAELCGLSPRYFGSVARGQTNASIIILEKLCKGFELTPNELLRIPPLSDSRLPMSVAESLSGCKLKVGVRLSCSSLSLLSVCKTILVRRYMAIYRQRLSA